MEALQFLNQFYTVISQLVNADLPGRAELFRALTGPLKGGRGALYKWSLGPSKRPNSFFATMTVMYGVDGGGGSNKSGHGHLTPVTPASALQLYVEGLD